MDTRTQAILDQFAYEFRAAHTAPFDTARELAQNGSSMFQGASFPEAALVTDLSDLELLSLRDRLTEAELLATDAAGDYTVAKGLAGDADDLPSAIPADMTLVDTNMPISISTIEGVEWASKKPIREWHAAGRVGPEPPRDAKLVAVMESWTPAQLANGREMDEKFGGDYQAWASAQPQPTRVDADFVGEAEMFVVDDSMESPRDDKADQEMLTIRRVRAEVDAETSRREAEAYDRDPDELRALEPNPDWVEERLLDHLGGAATSRYWGTAFSRAVADEPEWFKPHIARVAADVADPDTGKPRVSEAGIRRRAVLRRLRDLRSMVEEIGRYEASLDDDDYDRSYVTELRREYRRLDRNIGKLQKQVFWKKRPMISRSAPAGSWIGAKPLAAGADPSGLGYRFGPKPARVTRKERIETAGKQRASMSKWLQERFDDDPRGYGELLLDVEWDLVELRRLWRVV